MTKIWVAVKMDYSNCYYEGDRPDVKIKLGRSEAEVKAAMPDYDDVESVELP